jgi:hypothetical protein
MVVWKALKNLIKMVRFRDLKLLKIDENKIKNL